MMESRLSLVTKDFVRIDTQALRAHVVEMEPDLCEWLLGMNTHNRRLKARVIERYSKRFTDGEFITTNQGIGVVANAGSPFLADGQHRLHGWRCAGMPAGVKMVVVTGLPKEAQAWVDAGSNRSMTDLLTLLMDKSTSTQLVAIAKCMICIRERVVSSSRTGDSGGFTVDMDLERKLSPFDIASVIEHRLSEHMDLIAVCGRQRAPVTAAIVEYAERFDQDAAMEFAQQVAHGESLTRSDPAYRLRKWLESNRSFGSSHRGEHYGRTVSAICYHARGLNLDKLYAASAWSLPQRSMIPCGSP
jgi:hypothetical protein